MQKSVTVRPVNSLVFISDAGGGEVPQWVRGELILATPSCISVVCYPEQDGPTTITIVEAAQLNKASSPSFDGNVATPRKMIEVSNVDGERLLAVQVQSLTTRVRIWVDHPRWPERITIVLC